MRSFTLIVSIVVLLTLTSCGAVRDLAREITGQQYESNISFRIEQNLLWLENMTIEGKPGNYIVAASLRQTLLDESFAEEMGARARASFRGASGVSFEPDRLELDAGIDAMIGADVLGPVTLIDYHNQTVTRVAAADLSDADYAHQYVGQPSIRVTIDNRELSALVDTANPDTLHIPAAWIDRGPDEAGSRTSVSLTVGNVPFGETDVLLVERGPVRIGNRSLARFLVAIDYSARTVALWDRSTR